MLCLWKGEIRANLETREWGWEMECDFKGTLTLLNEMFDVSFPLDYGVTFSTKKYFPPCNAIEIPLLASSLQYIVSCVCRGVEGMGCRYTPYHPSLPCARKVTHGGGRSHRWWTRAGAHKAERKSHAHDSETDRWQGPLSSQTIEKTAPVKREAGR